MITIDGTALSTEIVYAFSSSVFRKGLLGGDEIGMRSAVKCAGRLRGMKFKRTAEAIYDGLLARFSISTHSVAQLTSQKIASFESDADGIRENTLRGAALALSFSRATANILRPAREAVPSCPLPLMPLVTLQTVQRMTGSVKRGMGPN